MSTSGSSESTEEVPGDLSWYAPTSLEARLSKRRNKAAGVGRTKVPMTEEDHRLAAGEAGYADVDRSSSGGPSGPAGSGAPAAAPAPTWTARTAADGPKLPGWAQVVEEAMGKADSTCTRISQVRCAKSTLPAFLQTYRLLVLPALAGLPGCTGARLLVSRTTDQEREDAEDQAREDRNSGGGRRMGASTAETVTITSVTDWTGEAASDAAVDDEAYAKALAALSTYMRGSAVSVAMHQALVLEKR